MYSKIPHVIVRLCLTLNQRTLIPMLLRLITLNFYLRIFVIVVLNKEPINLLT